MTRRFFLSLAVGLVAASAVLAFAPAPVFKEPPKAKVPELAAALQGTWEVQQNVNVAFRGRGLVAMKRLQQQIRITNTTWAYVIDNNGTPIESTKYEIDLDAKQLPATLDLKQDNNARMAVIGGMGGIQVQPQVAMKGIVKVEGDTMTFTYVYGFQAGAERPRSFSDGNVPNTMTMTLKRVR